MSTDFLVLRFCKWGAFKPHFLLLSAIFCSFFPICLLFCFQFFPSMFPFFAVGCQPVSWLSLPIASRLATEAGYAVQACTCCRELMKLIGKFVIERLQQNQNKRVRTSPCLDMGKDCRCCQVHMRVGKHHVLSGSHFKSYLFSVSFLGALLLMIACDLRTWLLQIS